MGKEYIKPSIQKKKIKINYFYSDSRYLDSVDMLEGSYFLTQGSWSCVDTCFLPDTNILMADGSYKKIQDIKDAESVISMNLVGNETAVNKIAKVVEKTYTEGYLLINNKLKITLNHKVWVKGKDWIEARDIQKGDILLNSKNEEVQVNDIEKFIGTFTVYNLHVDGAEHNFFAEDILVHNGQGECS